MAARLPDGSTVEIATTYANAKALSAISNASPAVATSTAHGFTDGDLIVIDSGWSRLDGRIVRVSESTADTFELENINTTSVTHFPAAAGAGSAREITAWTRISQVLEFTTNGGEPQFSNFGYLDEDFERQLPGVMSAQSITIGIADDPTLAGYIALKEASDARAVRALRVTLPNGSILLYNGIVSLNDTPSMTKGQVMQVRATFSLQSKHTRY